MTQPGDSSGQSGQGYWGQMAPPPPRPAPAAAPSNPYAPPTSPYAAPPPPQQPGFVPAWQQERLAPRPAPAAVSFDRMADMWGAAIITLGVILLLLSLTVFSWVDSNGLPISTTFGEVHTVLSYSQDAPVVTSAYFGWGAITLFILTALGAYTVRFTGSARTLAAVLVSGLAFLAAVWTFFSVDLDFNIVKIVDAVGVGYYTTIIGFVLIGVGAIVPKHARG